MWASLSLYVISYRFDDKTRYISDLCISPNTKHQTRTWTTRKDKATRWKEKDKAQIVKQMFFHQDDKRVCVERVQITPFGIR